MNFVFLGENGVLSEHELVSEYSQRVSVICAIVTLRVHLKLWVIKIRHLRFLLELLLQL